MIEKAFPDSIPVIPPIAAGMVRVWKKINRPAWSDAWADFDPKTAAGARMLAAYKKKATDPNSRVDRIEMGKTEKQGAEK